MNKYLLYCALFFNISFAHILSMDNQIQARFQIAKKNINNIGKSIFSNDVLFTKEILDYFEKEQQIFNEKISLLNNDFAFICYNYNSLFCDINEILIYFNRSLNNLEQTLECVYGYSNIKSIFSSYFFYTSSNHNFTFLNQDQIIGSIFNNTCLMEFFDKIILVASYKVNNLQGSSLEDKKNLDKILEIKKDINETLQNKQKEFYEIFEILFKKSKDFIDENSTKEQGNIDQPTNQSNKMEIENIDKNDGDEYKSNNYIEEQYMVMEKNQSNHNNDVKMLLCKICDEEIISNKENLLNHIVNKHQAILDISDNDMLKCFKKFMSKLRKTFWKKKDQKFRGGICLTCGVYICGSILRHVNINGSHNYCTLINKYGQLIAHKIGEKYTELEH